MIWIITKYFDLQYNIKIRVKNNISIRKLSYHLSIKHFFSRFYKDCFNKIANLKIRNTWYFVGSYWNTYLFRIYTFRNYLWGKLPCKWPPKICGHMRTQSTKIECIWWYLIDIASILIFNVWIVASLFV